MAGAQKKIVIVICTDPDATDSSSDEDESLLKVFNNKNKRKRLVREILLPAIATDVSWLPLPIGKCRKTSAKKKKNTTMMKKKSRYLGRGVGGGRFRKRWSEIPSSHVDRASGIASSGFGLLKDLPCLAKTPNSTITGVVSSSYGQLENFPNDTTANSVASPKRSGEDEEIDKDRDEASLCFVSNDAVVEAEEEEEEDRGMFGESLASSSPSSLAVETKGIGLGLGELLPSLDGPSSSSSHSPLAEELDRILSLMNPGHDPVVGNFSDYHPVFDASEATGGGFFDLSFDLDCDSLAWANVPEGCIA